jgi:hypothetical protein
MDEIRRLRFQIAPLLFLVSLGWGIWFDDSTWERIAASPIIGHVDKGLGPAITFIAGGGIVLFALGLVIGTVSYVGLRIFVLIVFRLCLWRVGFITHECFVRVETLRQMREKLEVPGEFDRRRAFFAAVSFDHGIIQSNNPGVYHWMVRRWNAFSIAVTSVTGLGLSLVVGKFFGIHVSNEWICPLVGLLVLFFLNAIFAWYDTMSMLAFQATIPIPEPVPDDT